MMVNWDFEQSILLSKSPKPDKKDKIQKCFGWETYTQQQHILFFFIVTSQTRHSVKYVMFTMCTPKTLCNTNNTNTTSLDITWMITSN